jgi:hypothetical protein
MQSSRDSSVWRSLAVAFGDGLAFGVGMKLTQPAGRASVATKVPDLTPLAHRLEQMEQRMAEIGNVPPALPAPEKTAPPAQIFDHKVLEAVVNALDARLREHSSQVERQITDLQARVTIDLTSLHQQDRSIADNLEGRIEALQAQVSDQLTALRETVQADREGVQAQIGQLHHDVADVLGGQLEAFQQQIREEVRQALGAVSAMAVSAADSVIEERVAPLRAAMAAKDQEIAELRSRLAGTDQATLDLLQGVGEICRRTAERFVTPKTTPPETPAAAEEPVEPQPQAATETVPGFAQSQPSGRLWRVPLVSSLVLTTGAMVMMHYLY